MSDNYASGYVGGGYAFGKAGLYEKGWRRGAVGAYGRYDYEGTLRVDGVYVPTTFDGQDAFYLNRRESAHRRLSMKPVKWKAA